MTVIRRLKFSSSPIEQRRFKLTLRRRQSALGANRLVYADAAEGSRFVYKLRSLPHLKSGREKAL